MPGLRDLQAGFMNFLQSRDGDIAALVIGDEILDSATRLAIYKNAYTTRLTQSLETDHPVLAQYLGDDLFDQMVSGYLACYPSQYFSLRDFGDSLPGYLAGTDPFASTPILAELARFERLLLFAFDASDAAAVTPPALHAIPACDWPNMRIVLHPSVSTFAACWNSVESWQAMRAGGDDTPMACASDSREWLLWRGVDRLTQFRVLSPEGKALFSVLASGGTFTEGCEALLDFVPQDEISPVAATLIVQWVGSGLISQLLS
jgi:hypothetical protein